MNVYLVLFLEFFKTGLFAIGGGLATLPFLYEMAEKYPWFPEEIMTDLVAVAESTPGPIGINAATYAGYNAAGVLGGVIATLGIVMPSFIIILIIAKALTGFKDNPFVVSAFEWLRPVVVALISTAFIQVLGTALIDTTLSGTGASVFDIVRVKVFVLMIVLMGLSFVVKKKRASDFHPIVYIGIAAAAGIIFKM